MHGEFSDRNEINRPAIVFLIDKFHSIIIGYQNKRGNIYDCRNEKKK